MDFLVSPLGWKNWLLLVAALINLSMAVFIFSRGVKKSKINLYFSLLTFFCFLWVLSSFFDIALLDVASSKFWFQNSFVSALGIAIFLFYFMVYFPFKTIVIKPAFNYAIWTIFFLLGFFSYTKWNLMFFDKSLIDNQFIIEYGSVFQWCYSVFFVVLVISALCVLWSKHKKVDNILKKDILFLFWVVLVGVFLGSYFNLVLDYMAYYSFEWLGPIFTVLMNFAAFYLIFFDKKQ